MAKSACFLEEVNLFVNALKKKSTLHFSFSFFVFVGFLFSFWKEQIKKKVLKRKYKHTVSRSNLGLLRFVPVQYFRCVLASSGKHR